MGEFGYDEGGELREGLGGVEEEGDFVGRGRGGLVFRFFEGFGGRVWVGGRERKS